jgi:aminoglycoside phosphotransferase (APT) family kinase protein
VRELDVTGRTLPRYRPYNDLTVRLPPAGSRRGSLWLHAMDVVAVPPVEQEASFLHRDYHPGNTLWWRGRLTGIVDWTSASWGPVGVDLGHMRWNLAVAYGPAAADAFLDCYLRLAPGGFAHDPYWDVRTVVDLLRHDPGWPFSGSDFDRLEAHLDRAVQAVSGGQAP